MIFSNLFSEDNKSYYKRLFSLAIPIIFQETLNSMINIVDVFMVGSLGLHAVTAVGLANLVFFLFIIIVFGVNSGSAIYFGQFWGKKDVPNIHKTMGLAFLSGSVLAVIVVFAVGFFAPQIMAFYSNGDQEVIRLGVIYLHAILPVYPLMIFIALLNAALRSIGMTKVPLATTLVGLTFNILFNAIFIFGLGLGVAGSAYATVLARLIEFSMQLFIIKKMNIPILAPIKNYFAFDRSFIKSFYVLIIPVVLNEFFWALGTMLYSVMYKTTGTEGQGAQQIAATMQNIFIVMGMAVGSSCAIMISNALGAGEIDKAVKYSRQSIVTAVGVSLVMSVVLFLVSPFIIGFYNVPESVKNTAFEICIVVSLGLALKTINFTTIIGVLRSGGDTKFCLLIDGLTVWFVGLPCLFICSYWLQLPIQFLVAVTYSEEIVKFYFCLKRTYSNCWAKSLVKDM